MVKMYPPFLPSLLPPGGVRHDLALQQHRLFFAAGTGKEGGREGGWLGWSLSDEQEKRTKYL